jgi:putative methanogenesis marker protein 14
MGPYFTVASVELGNTTTKCILSTTNLRTAEIFEIAKEVRFTRDVRQPYSDEPVFGETLTGIRLTRSSVAELVSDTISSVLSSVGMDIHHDLHFVVRSTGVTAGFASPDEVGEMVKALAEGCLKAGVQPRKMTAAISPDSLPPGLQDFTWLKRVYFDGAVASCLPPSNTSIVANEMEGELVTAGIKGAVKASPIDFRNPVMTMDFGTTLAGRVTDDSRPYAKTIGSFVGLAGAIPDALLRGTGLIENPNANMLDLPKSRSARFAAVNDEYVHKINDVVKVKTVDQGAKRFGTVPVDTGAAEEANVVLLGIDVGTNGSALGTLQDLGGRAYRDLGLDGFLLVLDFVQAALVKKLVSLAEENGIVSDATSLGLTGRAITTGYKPQIVTESLRMIDGSLWMEHHQLVFVEDGLAMGAAVAARCMNSLGTRENPMGGQKGDKCIMNERIKLQHERNAQSGRIH